MALNRGMRKQMCIRDSLLIGNADLSIVRAYHRSGARHLAERKHRNKGISSSIVGFNIERMERLKGLRGARFFVELKRDR